MRPFNIASDVFDFNYNNKNIKILWNRQNYSLSDEYDVNEDFVDRIEFEYNNVRVFDFFKSKNCEWTNRADRLCRVIDAGGKDAFEKYREYDEKIDNITDNYIIIDDKVFKPQIHNFKLDGSHTLYNMAIVMSDDIVIDGRDDSLFNKNEINLSRKTEYNRSKTFKTLVYKALQYHKKFNIEPKQEFLDEKLTSEFQKIREWFKSINIKINI